MVAADAGRDPAPDRSSVPWVRVAGSPRPASGSVRAPIRAAGAVWSPQWWPADQARSPRLRSW